jgi:hypothetical protein
MSTTLESKDWIFVNYAPGSFGSFLTKIIELSTSVSGSKNLEVFDEYNASHRNVSRWIGHLHDGDDIESWCRLSVEQQKQFIIDNIQTTTTTGKRVHRLTVPKYNSKFRQHFPNSSFVKLTVEPEQIELVAKNMVNKTFNSWLTNKVDDTLKTILSHVPENQQREHYLKECRQRIINIVDNSVESNTFNFPVSVFFDSEKFSETVNQLANWLDIDPIDITVLHKEFLTRHKEFIKQ